MSKQEPAHRIAVNGSVTAPQWLRQNAHDE
jgi:hypothetical protein